MNMIDVDVAAVKDLLEPGGISDPANECSRSTTVLVEYLWAVVRKASPNPLQLNALVRAQAGPKAFPHSDENGTPIGDSVSNRPYGRPDWGVITAIILIGSPRENRHIGNLGLGKRCDMALYAEPVVILHGADHRKDAANFVSDPGDPRIGATGGYDF